MKKIINPFQVFSPINRGLVHFYEIDNKPVFGKMTFTPGHNEAGNPAFLKIMGDLVDISNIKS